MVVLDGKVTSAKIRQELALKVKELKAQGKKIPHLAAILVGEDGASRTYVNAKVRDCEEVGFGSTLIKLPSETTEAELLKQLFLKFKFFTITRLIKWHLSNPSRTFW